MDIIEVRDYLLSLPSCEESQPFGEEFAVYKTGGKMFACTAFERPGIIALKCNPDRAVLLRDRFPSVTPAWHFNKKHWNDISIEMLDDNIVRREINHSYLTVIKKNVSPKSLKETLLKLAAEAGIEDAECPE
ncbi:MAG: MmcQ/YjbR family DNA-binding protein [Bacteroidales bacterium]|nr:MmcQ/YjbR family DNA-binding protein [Bacteroidales bacterium]